MENYYYKRGFSKIHDIVTLNASRFPNKTALVFKERRLTWRELNERINRLAHSLMDLGLQKGDRLGALFYNNIEAVEVGLAASKVGIVTVSLNFRNNAREIKWSLDNAKCKVLIYGEDLSGIVDPVKNDFDTVKTLIRSGKNIPPGEKDFEAFLLAGRPTEPGVKVELDDWARMMFTGGTTGVSKIVIHTHGNVMAASYAIMNVFDFTTPDEVCIIQPPLFHIGGVNILYGLFAAGGTVILVEAMDPEEMLRLIEKEKVTFAFLIPPQIYLRFTQLPNAKDFDLTSVKKLSTAAGLNNPQLFMEIFDLFPNMEYMYSGYGATELNSGCMGKITRNTLQEDPDKILSIGKEFPFTECKLVDDNRREVPIGTPGEAAFRSDSCFIGYFENPEATAATIDQDGWVYMGDIFSKDEKGYYYFVDRKKDMIKSGGENVFCQEVEAAMYSHPAVAECAIIGLPDPKWGELVTAVVQTKPGETVTDEEIIKACKRILSSYKAPKKVFFVDEFPKSPVGKIQKYKLREKITGQVNG